MVGHLGALRREYAAERSGMKLEGRGRQFETSDTGGGTSFEWERQGRWRPRGKNK